MLNLRSIFRGATELWETDDETETTDELGHEAPMVEAQATDEPGDEAPAAVEPIQTDSIASSHSTRLSREIRIVYTRRKRKLEIGPSAEPEPKKAREDVSSTYEIGESSWACHDLTTYGEPVDRSVATLATCCMRYEHQISSLQGSMSAMHELMQSIMGQLTLLEEDKMQRAKITEAAKASSMGTKQQMVTMGENVEAAVALATTCLMMFAVMIRAGGIALFPH
ncbi:hypothetical protein L1987_01660 [Smallanthus sonchifolius]|uniref:Uncharacterized protein n=1 Tax=Smallanthus sonchifolius TaxID=185202 RepID=A0ACB9K5N7_9ASTR|nr:hypothetical protein L1987_01660 [Smallanthus sonchifolius]